MADKLYANQAKLIFDKTAGSYVIGTVPGNSVQSTPWSTSPQALTTR